MKIIKNKVLWIGLSSVIVGLPMATIVSCEGDDSKLDIASKTIDKIIEKYKKSIQLTEYGKANKATTTIDKITESTLNNWFTGLPPITDTNTNSQDEGVVFYLRSIGAKGTDKKTLEIKWIAAKDNVAKEMVHEETGFSDINPDQQEVNAEKKRLEEATFTAKNKVLASTITFDNIKDNLNGLSLQENKFTYTFSNLTPNDKNGTLKFKIQIVKTGVATATATTNELTATDFREIPVIKKITAEKDKTGKVGISIEGDNLPIEADKYKVTKKGEENAINDWNAITRDPKKVVLEKTDNNLTGELTISLVEFSSIEPQNVLIIEIKSATVTKDADDKVTITITGNGLPTTVASFDVEKKVDDNLTKIDGWQIEGTASSTKVVLTKENETTLNDGDALVITLKGNPTVNREVAVSETTPQITKVEAEKDKTGKVGITIKGTNLPVNSATKYSIVNVTETNQEVLLDSNAFVLKPESDGVLLTTTAYPNISGKIKVSLVGKPNVKGEATIVEIKNITAEKGASDKVTITITGNGLPTTVASFDVEKKVDDNLTKIDGWQIEGTASSTRVVLTKTDSTLNANDNLVITLNSNPTVNKEVTISEFSTTNDFKINNITGELVEYTGSATEIEIPNSVKSIAQEVFRNKKITKLTFANGSQLTTIGNRAFLDNSIAGELTIPATVTTIGDNAFFNNKITKLTFATGSVISNIGEKAFANNEISGLLDLSHLNKLRTTKNATFDNNKITELKFHRNLMSFAGGVFSNNEISKVNSDVEGEFRFYYGTIIRVDQLANVNVNNKAFFKNKIKKVFYNEKIKFLNGEEQFDATVEKINKASTDYDENGVLKDSAVNPPTSGGSSIINWLRKRLKK